MNRKLGYADLLLLITAMFWGWTFIIVKWTVTSLDPYFFIFSRFSTAFLCLGILFFPKVRLHWRSCLKPGLILGLILAFGFITQTLGLKYTTASTSGFITGLNVILVSVFAAIITRKLPNKIVLSGVLAATAGLLLLTYKGRLEFTKGDLLTLACAVLFALHIVYTGRLARNLPAGVLTIIQLATVVIVSGSAYLILGEKNIHLAAFNQLQWLAILYCGILATAAAFLFQTKAQQLVSPFRTAILLATEPLFAGIFAIGLHFDPFDWKIVIGGLFIFTGMVLASWDVKEVVVKAKISR